MKVSEDESFLNFAEGVIRREIASFNLKGSSMIERNGLPKIKLEEIPLKKFSGVYAYFEKGNIYDNEVTVNIESETGKYITTIRLLYGRYGQYLLPDSVITDIYDPKFCEIYTKRGKPIESKCKVYRSEDKRRIYIYMLNGQNANRYEVTWIVQDGKYYGRTIDLNYP